MKILVSGASGFIGSAAVSDLEHRGHSVVPLVRSKTNNKAAQVAWEPSRGIIGVLPNTIDAVVHLAGENIVGRWTKSKKDRIYTSRITGTQILAGCLAAMEPKPKAFISASAIGVYGNRGDAVLTETSPAGEGFLGSVCRDWEAAAEPARQAGIRVVNLRIGMVLATHGGALAKMLPAFRIGLGGALGSGRQWVSWISLTDVVRAIAFALETETLSGPVNTVAPEPVTNACFAKTLGAALHRPAVIPIPAPVLRWTMGDFAQETLLASTRAIPEKLIQAGFRFEHPSLKPALSAMFA